MQNDDVPEHLIVRTLRAELEIDDDVSEEATHLLHMVRRSFSVSSAKLLTFPRS